MVDARGMNGNHIPIWEYVKLDPYTGLSAKGRFQSAERAVPTLRQLNRDEPSFSLTRADSRRS